MSLRVRFVLILTLVISVILSTCLYSVYTFYSHIRKNEFDKRLWAKAYYQYIDYYHLEETDKAILNRLSYYLPGNPVKFKYIMLDSAYKVIEKIPEKIHYNVNTAFLKQIKSEQKLFFSENNSQGLGLFLKENGEECYIIATAYDKYGIYNLNKLKKFMLFAGICAVLLIGLFTYFYVIWTTKPLVNISRQMRFINANNFTQKVKLRKGNARHNEITQIVYNFNNMLDRLEKAFHLQKNFVHHASHELRTPLATMLAQTESALRKNLTIPQARNVLESLKEDQQEMIDLTNSLLLLSQYENIHYDANWPKIRIDELLYETISSSQKMFTGITLNLNFTKEPEKESHLYIPGNEALLRSAVRNLIKNAYLYSDDKHVDISVEVHSSCLNIHIENNGKFIPEEERDRIFLPFFRGENTKNQKGFGLGLSIVKRITELHKGTVKYQVEKNSLNKFSLLFFRI